MFINVSILVNILFNLTRSREIADIIILTVQNYCLTFTIICNSLITYRLFLVISTNYNVSVWVIGRLKIRLRNTCYFSNISFLSCAFRALEDIVYTLAINILVDLK